MDMPIYNATQTLLQFGRFQLKYKEKLPAVDYTDIEQQEIERYLGLGILKQDAAPEVAEPIATPDPETLEMEDDGFSANVDPEIFEILEDPSDITEVPEEQEDPPVDVDVETKQEIPESTIDVSRMTKAQLVELAKEKYDTDLDDSKTVRELRKDVNSLMEQ